MNDLPSIVPYLSEARLVGQRNGLFDALDIVEGLLQSNPFDSSVRKVLVDLSESILDKVRLSYQSERNYETDR